MKLVNERGSGVVMYVDGHEGRGIGLHNKIKAYNLQIEQGLDTYMANEVLGFPRDSRTYETPKAILKHLGISKIDLITNNPLKIGAFQDIVSSTVPCICVQNVHNEEYIKAKRVFEASPVVTRTSAKPVQPLAKHEKEIPLRIPSRSDVAKLRIGVLRTSWNESLVSSLANQCVKMLLENGVKEENLFVAESVPGSFELPFAAQALASSGNVDAVMCFGVLIKGETTHFENISSAVSQGLMQVQLSANVPVINGVLTCLSYDQAESRCIQSSTLPVSLSNTAIQMASYKKGLQMNSFSVPITQPCSQG